MNTDADAETAYTEGMRTATVCGRPDDTPEPAGQPPRPMPLKPRRKPRRPGNADAHGQGTCALCDREAATLVPPEYLFCRHCGYDRPRAAVRWRP